MSASAPGSSHVLHRQSGGALFLTLNHPDKLNALDHALGTALLDEIRRAGEDASVRTLVLRGAGAAFCAGDDITALVERDNDDANRLPAAHTGEALYLLIVQELVRLPKPVVAAIQGVAMGAGLEIACAADLRICAESARLGSGLIKLGHAGNGVMLLRTVGPSRATEIYLSGRLVPAAEALAIGLVHEVHSDPDFEAAVDEAAARLAAAPTRAIGLFKRLREGSLGARLEEACRLQDEIHVINNRQVADGQEGLAAFVERRQPQFSGS